MSFLKGVTPTDPISAKPPEVVINSSVPYPGMPGFGSRYFYTTPDAQINQANELTGSLAQQAQGMEYAGPNRLGTQTSYLNVPHVMSTIIPSIMLPSGKRQQYGNDPFKLKHPYMQKGEIAFSVRLPVTNPIFTPDKRYLIHNTVGYGIDLLLNVQCVNFILHALQLYRDTEPQWKQTFWDGFGLGDLFNEAELRDPNSIESVNKRIANVVVEQFIRPMGIVTAVEYRGENNEAVSLIIDGRAEQVMNYWGTASFFSNVTGERITGNKRKQNQMDIDQQIEAGDDLIMLLRKKWASDDVEFLSHALPRALQREQDTERMGFPQNGGVWQLEGSIGSPRNRECWGDGGYWHIAFCKAPGSSLDPENAMYDPFRQVDVETFRAKHVLPEVTFAPCWKKRMGDKDDHGMWGGVWKGLVADVHVSTDDDAKIDKLKDVLQKFEDWANVLKGIGVGPWTTDTLRTSINEFVGHLRAVQAAVIPVLDLAVKEIKELMTMWRMLRRRVDTGLAANIMGVGGVHMDLQVFVCQMSTEMEERIMMMAPAGAPVLDPAADIESFLIDDANFLRGFMEDAIKVSLEKLKDPGDGSVGEVTIYIVNVDNIIKTIYDALEYLFPRLDSYSAALEYFENNIASWKRSNAGRYSTDLNELDFLVDEVFA